ncbi:DUF2255 family protein [Pasteurella bettyae]|uniref:PF10012 family protein n=1 Tax=Pasteurella bettyae CCUG 2042 TaxID=1095749 RepID=I3DBI5_9PAST|nr:DUF2255 family protein [Pasteurella bettyae]EIJ69078.1 PF10012 family protein [Pasteurella bettyae CCUG 2042]SUB22866.1 Uncharacterized protein conserved in bacteria (DUF2255) [Pasteurella bettyae]
MWNLDQLQQINQADDLRIAPFHTDMETTGTPTWIWEVIVDNRLFARAYNGKSSCWYQAASQQKAGHIHSIGDVFNVVFASITDEELNKKIDEAYRQKYADSPYMKEMISPRARNATIEILLSE